MTGTPGSSSLREGDGQFVYPPVKQGFWVRVNLVEFDLLRPTAPPGRAGSFTSIGLAVADRIGGRPSADKSQGQRPNCHRFEGKTPPKAV